MKYAYRVILMGLILLGVVYASTGPDKKTEEIENTEEVKNTKEVEKKTEIEAWKYKPIDLCNFPVSMKVGHYVQFKACNKREIKLEQVDCKSIGRERDFPCYKGSDVIEVRANFPAILSATIDKSSGDEEILEEVNLYWEDGVNTIQGCTGDWEELTLCLEAWGVDLWKFAPGTIDVGEITIQVRCPEDPKDEPEDDKKSED
jgi:hypothetical protein